MRIPIKNDTVAESELRDYLLGRIDGDACERLDELSVCDDAFAERLRAAENDLADAYVRGELKGDDLQRFDLHYMSTAMRRKKVDLARTLYVEHVRAGSAPGIGPAEVVNRETTDARRGGLFGLTWVWQNLTPRWAFAWAALAIFAVSATWLAISNYHLRTENRDARQAYGALEKQYQQLEQQAANHPQPESETPASGTDAGVPAAEISSLTLPPPLRSSERVPAVSLAATDKWLQLKLGLEANDFSEYRIDVKDLALDKYVWHSGPVKSSNTKQGATVAVLVPAEKVKNRGHYVADMWGIAERGKSELLGEYVFQIADAGSSSNMKK